jgi:5-methylcytosine-specific restriction endonuclease McrA
MKNKSKAVKIQARGCWDKSRYGEDWKDLAHERKKLDNFTCVECGYKSSSSVGTGLHADHIIPISQGGRNTLSNLRTVCVECHKKKHKHMR